MTDKEALQAIARGEKLPQSILMQLWHKGLIELIQAPPLRSLESEESEDLFSYFNPQGRRMLEE